MKVDIIQSVLLAAVIVLAQGACSTYGQEPSDAGMDSGDGASGDGGEFEPRCAYGEDFAAQFSKECDGDQDCTLVFISKDCCGTALAVGVNASDAERMSAAWQACLGQLSQCGCPAGMPEAEDGNSTQDTSEIRVRCQDGNCSSYLP